MTKTSIAIILVAGAAIGLAAGSGALVAWAVTAIWPQLPFWPVAILATIILFNNQR